MNKKTITTLSLSLLAATCVGSVAMFGLSKNTKIISKATDAITRTARWDTWEVITTSGGNSWGLGYYGQSNGIVKDTGNVCTSVKIGSMIYPVDEDNNPICFANLISIDVNYDAQCDESVEAISVYNTNSPVIGDGVDAFESLYGTDGNNSSATYNISSDKRENRYVFFRVSTHSEVCINWFSITYSC